MQNVKITKSLVEQIPYSEKPIFVRDSEVVGFALRIGKTSKTFVIERRNGDETFRMKIGRYPDISVEAARKIAQEKIAEIITGSFKSPKANENKITLNEILSEFVKNKSGTMKEKTLKSYLRDVDTFFSDLKACSVSDISSDIVCDRHRHITNNNGKAIANRAGRVLRSILNFGIVMFDLQIDNPYKKVGKMKLWNRVPRRRRIVRANKFAPLLQAIDTYHNTVMSDYFHFILFTGCRLKEAACLRWEDVDLDNRSFIIRNPKNHNPLELPLSDFLMKVMHRREANRVNDFVFPSYRSASGHIEEPKKVAHHIGEQIGSEFSVHDLRRTFITVAESLDISHYALKALVNHSLSGSDVTAGYIIMDIERLRAPMQMITNKILGKE